MGPRAGLDGCGKSQCGTSERVSHVVVTERLYCVVLVRPSRHFFGAFTHFSKCFMSEISNFACLLKYLKM